MDTLIGILVGFAIIQLINCKIDPANDDYEVQFTTEWWLRKILFYLLFTGSFVGAFMLMYYLN
jgi:hypothetical protein